MHGFYKLTGQSWTRSMQAASERYLASRTLIIRAFQTHMCSDSWLRHRSHDSSLHDSCIYLEKYADAQGMIYAVRLPSRMVAWSRELGTQSVELEGHISDGYGVSMRTPS